LIAFSFKLALTCLQLVEAHQSGEAVNIRWWLINQG